MLRRICLREALSEKAVALLEILAAGVLSPCGHKNTNPRRKGAVERPQSPFDGVFACLDAPPRPPLLRFGPPVTAPRSTSLLLMMTLGRRRSETVACVAVVFCSSCDARSCQHADAQASITFNTVASATLWQSHRSCVCVAHSFCAGEQHHATRRHAFGAATRLRVDNEHL